MALLAEAVRLRILIGDDDTYNGQPLCDAIVDAARQAGLAGITALRGIAGYGRSAQRHEVYSGFAHDLPIIIEVIDDEGPIAAWLPALRQMMRGGLVTIEKIHRVEWPTADDARQADA